MLVLTRDAPLLVLSSWTGESGPQKSVDVKMFTFHNVIYNFILHFKR